MKRSACLLIILICFSCSESSKRGILVNNIGSTQNTFYNIQYLSQNGENFQFQIDSILNEIDSSLSTYKSYSTISKINKESSCKTDALFNAVFKAAKKVYLESDKSFDCTIAPLVNGWGFGFLEKETMDSIKIEKLLSLVGFDKVMLIEDSLVKPKGVMLDFNAIAQGYSVDLIANFLENQNCVDYLVEIGGEIRAEGRNPDKKFWRVAIEKPNKDFQKNERFSCIMKLKNTSLATSGNYRKFLEEDGVKYSHTINPFTGFPEKNNLLSATVLHNECMLADAYATAFMVLGVKKSKILSKELQLPIYLIFSNKNGNIETYLSPELEKQIVN